MPDYVWKHYGPSTIDVTSLRFVKALHEAGMFADLRNGHTYTVLRISQVKEPGELNRVPKEMLHTSDAKPIADEKLAMLRRLHKADVDPDWPYLILF